MGVSRLYRAGIAGTQGCEDDDDLYARDEPAGAKRDQPAGPDDGAGRWVGTATVRSETLREFRYDKIRNSARVPLRYVAVSGKG